MALALVGEDPPFLVALLARVLRSWECAERVRAPRRGGGRPRRGTSVPAASPIFVPITVAEASALPDGDPDDVPPELGRLLDWLAAEAVREMLGP